MTDDKASRGVQDRSRIVLNEPYEVESWTQALNVPEQSLRGAILEVGSRAAEVHQALGKTS